MSKVDITTRIEEENKGTSTARESVLSSRDRTETVPLPELESDDDNVDVEVFKKFSVQRAWDELLEIPSCYKVMINEKCQKNMGIAVGTNISQEFPWKQLKYKILDTYLFDEIENSMELHEKFIEYGPEELVLVGYAPIITQNLDEIPEGDPFLVFVTHEGAKRASTIIKNIETYERWLLNKTLTKKSRYWRSKGSEKEVNLNVRQKPIDAVAVEIQSVYPMVMVGEAEFGLRTTADVRDGYVELVPGEKKFENLYRRRVDTSIQSAPAKVTLEQQTDPTFPTNAWAQYFYEINEEDDGLDISSEDEEKEKEKEKDPGTATGSKAATPAPPISDTPPPPPEVSHQIKELMGTLDFNQIDMYRNDYPLISSIDVPKQTTPYLEEILCFTNIAKSHHRFVCGIDWYPTISGLVVISYTFSTVATSVDVQDKTDTVQRSILQKNPVLMWSFNDSLNFKLELDSSREITVLSFCPYNENILVGGTMNGQVIIWDLQGRAHKLDYEEILTTAQSEYRDLVQASLEWTVRIDEQILVFPTITSALDGSQTGPITNIKWLNRRCYVSSHGKVFETSDQSNRYFMTNSVDGTIAFWNLDVAGRKAASAASAKRKLPPQLMQSESAYKCMDKILKPVFMVAYPEPLTATICDVAKFEYTYKATSEDDFTAKFPIQITAGEDTPLRRSLVTASFYGRIEMLHWEGFDTDLGDGVPKEKIQASESFARVHDGPVVALERNPFYPDIFASIGRNVFAIWKEDFRYTPIMWRYRPIELTHLKWSVDRPSVLFLTRADGGFEAWDILTRDDDACLYEILGGGIVTALSEHRPSVPKKYLGIGDYNSSFRMMVLPENFRRKVPNELKLLQDFISREEQRKLMLRKWEQDWYDKNADIREAKKQSEAEALKELERLQKEADEIAFKKAKQEAEVTRKALEAEQKKSSFDLPERLEKKWDALNLRRLLSVLMSRKKVDPEKLEKQTAMEKERLAYERRKRKSLKKSIHILNEEVAAVRARILPAEKADLKRSDLVMASVNAIIEQSDSYAVAESEFKEFLDQSPECEDITYIEFVSRGVQRRKILDRSLGGNTQRHHRYTELKRQGMLGEFEFGYERFIAQSERESQMEQYSDLDLVPVKDAEE